MGTPAEHWYYAGRDHIFFAVEDAIHHGASVSGLVPVEGTSGELGLNLAV